MAKKKTPRAKAEAYCDKKYPKTDFGTRMEVVVDWLDGYKAGSRDHRPRPPKCEGCNKKATRTDSEGVPLCKKCYDSLVRQTKRDKRITKGGTL